jgi:hypothetical protein
LKLTTPAVQLNSIFSAKQTQEKILKKTLAASFAIQLHFSTASKDD